MASYANTVIVVKLSMRIVAKLQRQFFDRLLEQGMEFFTEQNSGGLMQRFNQNANAARNVIEMVAMTLWRDLFSLFSLILVMVIQNPTMSLITLFIGPPAVLGVLYLMRQVKNLALDEVAQASAILAVLENTLVEDRERGVQGKRAVVRVEPWSRRAKRKHKKELVLTH